MTRHGKLDILLNNAGVATRYQNLSSYTDSGVIIYQHQKMMKMLWCRNHPNDPPEHLDVAEMTNVFATNVGGTCAATQVIIIISISFIRSIISMLYSSLGIPAFATEIFVTSSSLYFLFPRQHLKVNTSSSSFSH